MFSKLFAVASLAVFATAIPTNPPAVSQCNTGTIQCCNSVQDAGSQNVATTLGLLGIPVQGLTGIVGLGCTTVPVIGAASSCGTQQICCQDNKYNGLVNIGCSPITA